MPKWQNKAAVVSKNDRSSPFRPRASGRPTEAAIQAMLDAPKAARANEVGTKAQMSTETGADPNRRDLPRRFARPEAGSGFHRPRPEAQSGSVGELSDLTSRLAG